MEEKPRFAIRRGAVGLTRRQWVILGGVLGVGIAATIVLVVVVSLAAGGVALGATAVAAGLTIGFGRLSQSGG
ncbi:hypothetical protein AB0C07_09200 [Actinoplanes missouriensis]|uniref:hypothetical protein n=1 Tax=Actinoplanes missouriensis TaxID=1866 RepID=UPI0033D83DF6